jgi:hypothetical protein
LLLVGWSASLLSLQGGSNAVAAGLDLLVGKLSPIDSPPPVTQQACRRYRNNATLQQVVRGQRHIAGKHHLKDSAGDRVGASHLDPLAVLPQRGSEARS